MANRICLFEACEGYLYFHPGKMFETVTAFYDFAYYRNERGAERSRGEEGIPRTSLTVAVIEYAISGEGAEVLSWQGRVHKEVAAAVETLVLACNDGINDDRAPSLCLESLIRGLGDLF